MFFILSKVVWYLVQPLVIVMLFLAVGLLACAFRFVRTGIAVAGIGLTLLVVASITPAGLLMMNVLEERIPPIPPEQLPAQVAGIVVLGGAIDTRIARTRQIPELNDAADRITAAVALSRRYPEARLIFSGGSAAVLAEDIAESIPARELFLSLGVPEDRLLLEERSRNTYENAVFSREIAQPQPGETWLLVTSAFHMARSVGCFRQAGFAIVPYPVDYRTPSGAAVWQPSSASIRNVEKVHFSIREFIGLAAYWMTGRTDALFPSA